MGIETIAETVAKATAKARGEKPPEKQTSATGGSGDAEVKKEMARKLVESLATEDPNERLKAEQEIQKQADDLKTAKFTDKEAQSRFVKKKIEASTDKLQKHAGWLVKAAEGVSENPDAALFIERIANAEPDLQNDPYFLLSEGTKFMWQTSSRWDLSPEAVREAHAVLRSVQNKVVALARDTPNFPKELLKDDNRKILEALIPEARMGMAAPSRTGESWIDMIDMAGNKVEPPDTFVDTGGHVHDLRDLKRTLQELRAMGNMTDPHQIDRQYRELVELAVNPDGSPTPIAEIVQPYLDRIDQTYDQLFGERHSLTPEMVHRISRDSVYRDEQFYERLKKLLETPEEESHHVMQLYEKHDLDAFMHAVSEMEVLGPDGKPVPESERRKVTEDIRRMYEIRIGGLMNFHDVDYWARHGSGDIKSFQGTVARIQNYQAKEALSDPYVQTMRNCYEKALLFIRASHNGYIPPNLVSPDPLRSGRTYWDDLALEFFNAKVEAGEVFDVVRDQHGRPKSDVDREGNVFQLSETAVTPEIIERQRLRLMATQQIARGILDLDMRTLEIIGMSKVPGFNHAEFGTKDVAFSSKAYGQLARWFNMTGEWMGKYKMGTTLHVPFFQTLMEGKPTWRPWTTDQWRQVMEATMEGHLEEKFGPEAKRFLDMVEELSFSGRWGPMSGWGIHDATLGWSDRDKERLGGSIRMASAKGWAEARVKEDYKKTAREKGKGAAWIDRHWEKDKNQGEWKNEIDKLFKTQRAYLWVQTVMRHPTIVAGYLREPVFAVGKDGKPIFDDKGNPVVAVNEDGFKQYRLLRDRIIGEILDINMDDFYKTAERTPGDKERAILGKISQLEADVDAVQQRAMQVQSGEPRDIEEKDFDIIHDEERRAHAKEYWKKTTEAVLGKRSANQWYEALGVGSILDVGKDTGNIEFAHYQNIDQILENAESAWADGSRKGVKPLMCNENILTKSMMQHMSTEDVQWRFLDIETLGPPHWNRRVGDLATRIEATQKAIAYLDMLTASPDIPKLAGSLREVYIAEKNHDPMQAYKIVWLFAKATGDLYRQAHWGRLIPYGGRIASKVVPSSVAQKFFETTRASAWSANNERQWADQFSDGNTLPKKRFYGGKDWGEYNAGELAQSIGATRAMQILEIVILATGISMVLTVLLAAKKALEEEGK